MTTKFEQVSNKGNTKKDMNLNLNLFEVSLFWDCHKYSPSTPKNHQSFKKSINTYIQYNFDIYTTLHTHIYIDIIYTLYAYVYIYTFVILINYSKMFFVEMPLGTTLNPPVSEKEQ